MPHQDDLTALVSGLLLCQQVLIEMLVRNDAIGYPQARTALEEVVAALRKAPAAVPAAIRPLEQALALLDDQHRPLGSSERPHPVDWKAQLMRIQAG